MDKDSAAGAVGAALAATAVMPLRVGLGAGHRPRVTIGPVPTGPRLHRAAREGAQAHTGQVGER